MSARSSGHWVYAIAAVTLFVLALSSAITGGWTRTAVVALAATISLFLMSARLPAPVRPWLDWLYPLARLYRQQATRTAEMGRVVVGMWAVVEAFGLCKHIRGRLPDQCDFDLRTRQGVIEDMLARTDANLAASCAHVFGEKLDLNGASSGLSALEDATVEQRAGLLELLYQDRWGRAVDVNALWRKHGEDLSSPLAELLIHGQRLPEGLQAVPGDSVAVELRTDDHTTGAGHPALRLSVAELLRQRETFSLSGVVDDLRVVALVLAYCRFLDANGIAAEPPDALISPRTADTLSLLLSTGASAVPQQGGEESVALVSAAMFLSRAGEQGSTLLRAACTRIGNDPAAVRLTLVLLQMRERRRPDIAEPGLAFVTLSELVDGWESELATMREELGDSLLKDLEALQVELLSGHWPRRLPRIVEHSLQRALTPLSAQVEALQDEFTRRPCLETSLRRAFRSVPLNVVERYLETRSTTAYLLTFTGSGPFADLIDYLVRPDEQDHLQELGITTSVDGRPKYAFSQHTRNARIGIAPRGWTLERFYGELACDLRTLTAATANPKEKLLILGTGSRPLGPVELTLQRFGLSRRDHFGFTTGGRAPHGMPEIRNLLADRLGVGDLVATLGYAQPGAPRMDLITRAMAEEGTVSDLLGDDFEYLPGVGEKNQLEKRDANLKNQLRAGTGCATLREVGALHRDGDATPRKALVGALAEVPAFADGLARREYVADRYLDSLGAIASL